MHGAEVTPRHRQERELSGEPQRILESAQAKARFALREANANRLSHQEVEFVWYSSFWCATCRILPYSAVFCSLLLVILAKMSIEQVG